MENEMSTTFEEFTTTSSYDYFSSSDSNYSDYYDEYPATTPKALDEWEIFFAELTAFLVEINFGYICNSLFLVIILISIFGGIKESYRWIIFHQAIWDSLIAYNFICYSPIVLFQHTNFGTCFYSSSTFSGWTRRIASSFDIFNKDSPYLTLFLLSFTRFTGLFYSNFHDRITKGIRIYMLIIFSDLLFIVTSFGYVFFEDLVRNDYSLNGYCSKVCCDEEWQKCMDDPHFEIILYDILDKIFMTIVYIRSSILLALSFIFTILIILRISKQANYQLKNKQKDFWATARISAVLFFQSILTLLLFILETHANIKQLILFFFGAIAWRNFEDTVFTINLPTLRPIRAFIDAILILAIMTGYREAIFRIIKLFWNFPKRFKQEQATISTRNIVQSFVFSINEETVSTGRLFQQ